MLVLTRKINERIMVGDAIRVTVCRLAADEVRLGFEAPRAVVILREEVRDRFRAGAPEGGALPDGTIDPDDGADPYTPPRHPERPRVPYRSVPTITLSLAEYRRLVAAAEARAPEPPDGRDDLPGHPPAG